MDNVNNHTPSRFQRAEEPPSDPAAYLQYLNRIFLADRNLQGVKATWLGLPSSLGQPDKEPAAGPVYMRKLNALAALKTTGADIEDAGDIVPPTTKLIAAMRNKLRSVLKRLSSHGKSPLNASDNGAIGGVHNLDKLVPYSQDVTARVKEILNSGRKVVTVGGDHSIAMATIAGALEHFHGDLGVIWVDAHGDINVPKYEGNGSRSGNAHGMPVAHLMGLERANPELAGLTSKTNRLKPENIIYIGLKDLDAEEIKYLESMGITYFTVENSTTAQLTEICRKIDELQNRVGHMWSSIDLDGLDQTVAPATRMRNKGGISYEMITSLTQYIGVTTNLVGMDIAEFAPKFDDKDDKTAKLILELIARQLGGSKKRWDATAYLEKPVLAESPRKKARRRKIGFAGGLAAGAAAATLSMMQPNFNTPRQKDIVDDESLGRSGLTVAKEGISFLPILTPEWSADSGANPVDLFSHSGFAEAARKYAEEKDPERRNHALSEMMTYLHAALLKASDQSMKNRIWDVAANFVGQDRRSQLMAHYRRFISTIDDEKVTAWLKVVGDLPPG